MDYNYLLNLLDEIKNIREFVQDKYPNYEIEYKSHTGLGCGIDKLNRGFNIDDRFQACKGHMVHYDTKKGYYGNSGCSSILSITSENAPLFWNCFDRYLNQHQDEILLSIAEMMQKEVTKNVTTLEDKVKEINAIIKKIKEGEQNG